MRVAPSARRSALRLLLLLSVAFCCGARGEDGYDLWLRYRPIEKPWRDVYAAATTELVTGAQSPVLLSARRELMLARSAMLGAAPALARRVSRDGALVIGTPRSNPRIAALNLDLRGAGSEGYVIRSVLIGAHRTTIIAANEDAGVLHGVFGFLQLLQTRRPVDRLDLRSAPGVKLRVLDHWDNLDGTVERGYAGASLWDWHRLPDYLDPRYRDYARACASIGLNGVVLNNVNASALSLAPAYLRKVVALADLFRQYGIRVYLSVRFSAPVELGGLATADPLDSAVRAWWRAKTDEIYREIPDFGGFLVKANSEGQPGPQDYGRTHADGANLLADVLAAHGGTLMWRAFVYGHDGAADRTMQAYEEFRPLDGKFHDNVLLQVKNGPLDFQPREPFHPLFGAMPGTPLMLELQITKEYLGFSTHLAYLGTLWQETLSADTGVQGTGSSVRRIIDGSLQGQRLTGMAGVANVGADRNWTGSHFDQANWYAFGRLSWDPSLDAGRIAEDWLRMTFSNHPTFLRAAVPMMLGSREAVVDYMTPLGLHHQMARDHHYGPGPWVSDAARADWNSTYYNRADAQGIGFERGPTGSNAVSQYASALAQRYADPRSTPESLLLWFHHVAWDYRLASGETLWDALLHHYDHGVAAVHQMRQTWSTLAHYVDSERHAQVASFLGIQEREAQWWRDASIAYFQSVSQLPLPADVRAPPRPLDYYKSLCFASVPGIAQRPTARCQD